MGPSVLWPMVWRVLIEVWSTVSAGSIAVCCMVSRSPSVVWSVVRGIVIAGWSASPTAVCYLVPRRLNNNNILYSSLREIKAVVRSHNEEHISIILNHETLSHTPPFFQSAYTNSKPKISWNMLLLSNQNVKTLK